MNPDDDTLPADRSAALTEAIDPAGVNLDTLDTAALLAAMNREDAKVAAAVALAIDALTPLVDAVVDALEHDGRLIYLGAGTSGRLGVLDASECPPTFHTDPSRVIGIIAGGDTALRQSSEGKEDDPAGALSELQRLCAGRGDVVVGIAAGGSTPYVLGGLDIARSRGCVTGLVTCVKLLRRDLADHLVEVLVGPEVIAGSSRLKAGTATKLVLNMLTTAAMVKLGKTWGNLMVDLRASNDKLRDRAARIIMSQTRLSRAEAFIALDQAQGHAKAALVMVLLQVDLTQAHTLLAQHQGRLRSLLGPPRG
jgi:N-acetylmuramic acid 6-phosphate etherase